ncbi:MAG: hypothetical protein HKN32_00125, partial [Flavobacteriales bacterium]|nr:hypothetical protein [Flavobacteriales bacterium]
MNSRTALLMIVSIFLFNESQTQTFLEQTLSYDGEIREYSIYIPANYDGSSSYPVVFNFHGGGGDISDQIAIADMSDLAEAYGFFVIYPQALPDPNDGGSNNW